jgi:hypothetical protein
MILVRPSEIKAFAANLYPDTACNRRWAFEHIDGVPNVSTPKQAFGTDVHKHHENYLRHGTLPPDTETGRVAKMAILHPTYLPKPSPNLLIEAPFQVRLSDALGFHGTPDLIDPNLVRLNDHKTTSDVRYALTEDQLRQDSQGILYSMWLMMVLGTQHANLCWGYHVINTPTGWPGNGKQRSPRKMHLTETRFSNEDEDFRVGIGRMIAVAEEIEGARKKWKTAHDAPPNTLACEAFGGCPHKAACKRDTHDLLASHLAQFDKREKAKYPGLTIRLGESNLAENKHKEKEPMSTLFDEIKAQLAAVGTVAATETPTSFIENTKAPEPASDNASDVEAEMTRESYELQMLKTHINDLKKMGKAVGLRSGMNKPDLVAALVEHEFPAPKAPAAPPPIQRPPMIATVLPPTVQASEPRPIHAGEREVRFTTGVDPGVAAGDDPDTDLIVLFDCGFRKRPNGFNGMINLADYVDGVAQKVAADNGQTHFGLIPYAQGAPALAAYVEKIWQAQPPTGVVLVDSDSLYGRALKDILVKYAKTVVQAMR